MLVKTACRRPSTVYLPMIQPQLLQNSLYHQPKTNKTPTLIGGWERRREERTRLLGIGCQTDLEESPPLSAAYTRVHSNADRLKNMC